MMMDRIKSGLLELSTGIRWKLSAANGRIEDAFDHGYHIGQIALRKRSAERLRKGCPKLARPSMERLAAGVGVTHQADIQKAWIRYSLPASKEWRRRLWSAWHRFQASAGGCRETFSHLLGYMQITMRGSDPALESRVEEELRWLHDGEDWHQVCSQWHSGPWRGHDHGAVEMEGDPSCGACRFEAGLIQGQMEMILSCLASRAIPDREEVVNLLYALSDCAIPFPLAPPSITGWKGCFLDFQRAELIGSSEKWNASARNLFGAYLKFKLTGDLDAMNEAAVP